MSSYDYSEAYLQAIREANERESGNKLHTLLLLLTYFPIFKNHLKDGRKIFPDVENPMEVIQNRIEYLKTSYNAEELEREKYLDYYKEVSNANVPELLKKKILFFLDAVANEKMTNAQIMLDEIIHEL